MTKIVALESRNVKRLRAVEIEPDGSLVIIGGKNAQGKTSVLDSIMYALGGRKVLPEKPLREGAKKGSVKVELDNGLTVTRTFTKDGGGTLRVTSGKSTVASPQKMLDKLVGALTFDPLAFDGMKPADRLATLAGVTQLDFKRHDEIRAAAYESRTERGREVKRLEGALTAMEPVVDPEGERVAVTEAITALTNAQTLQGQQYEQRQALESSRREVVRLREAISDVRGQLERLEAAQREEQVTFDRLDAEVQAHEDPGVEAAQERLEGAEAINAAHDKHERAQALKAELRAARKGVETLTDQIDEVDAQKEKMLKEAPFPIEGLAFGDDDVLFGGVPWSQASLAERIRVSVAMGFAVNPDLKVMLIRDASLLDEDNLALVAQLAEEAEGQVWLERVGDGDEGAVIIEDGHIREEPGDFAHMSTPEEITEGFGPDGEEPALPLDDGDAA